MNPSNYRARLLRDIFQAWVLPPLSLWSTLSIFDYELGFLSVPIHIIFIILWATVKSALVATRRAREAQALNARPIPRAVGKWPGNIDLLLRMMLAFKTSYVLDVYLQLFEEYQCTTLNLRLLWRDNVCVFCLWVYVFGVFQ